MTRLIGGVLSWALCLAAPPDAAAGGRMQVSLQALPGNAQDLTGLQWTEFRGQLHLLASRRAEKHHWLQTAPVSEPDSFRPLFQLGSLVAIPQWSARAEGEQWLVAFTIPGSAVCKLAVTDGAQERVITTAFPSGVFQCPRISRGDGPVLITAVSRIPSATVMMFDDGFDRSRSPQGVPGTPTAALLVYSGQDRWLLVQTYQPDQKPFVRGTRPPSRTDGAGNPVLQGHLVGMLLSKGLERTVASFRPFGSEAIFEFDAVPSAGRLIVIATGTGGLRAVAGTLTSAGFAAEAGASVAWEKELAHPTLIGFDGRLHLAAIESAGTPQARIVTGTLSLER